MRYQNPTLQDKLAAEYVMGNMTALTKRRFEALLLQYPETKQAVVKWSELLQPLNDNIPPQTPPAKVWSNIESSINPGKSYQFLFSALAAGILAFVIFISYPIGPKQYRVTIRDAMQRAEWIIRADPKHKAFTISTINPPNLPANKQCVLWISDKNGSAKAVTKLSDIKGSITLSLADDYFSNMENAQVSVSIEEDAGQALLRNQPSREIVFSGKWQYD